MPMTEQEPPRTAQGGLAPHLVVDGAADAIGFYRRAFGAEEKLRVPGPNGKLLYAAIEVNGSTVMLVDEFPEMGGASPKALQGSPVIIHLYVEDVDAFVNRAVEAGATLTMPVDDMFWGDRYGRIEDPFGHQWSIATHQRDMTEAEIRTAAETVMAEMGW